MKPKIHLSFLILTFCSLTNAEISFTELQNITNKIYLTETKLILGKELPKYLEILKKRRNTESCKEYDDAVRYTNAYFTAMEMALEPPAIALPKLFALFENKSLNQQTIKHPLDNHDESLREWAYHAIESRMGTDLAPDLQMDKYRESIIFNWMPPKSSYTVATIHFYYSGRKHLKTLWEVWYDCWKKEQSRQNPRPEVEERLLNEITSYFGYNIFQFVAEAIESGDETMSPLVRKLEPSSGYEETILFASPELNEHNVENSNYYLKSLDNFQDTVAFLKWWKENKHKYVIPEPDKKLSDLKPMLTDQKTSSHADIAYKRLLELEHALIKFCNQPLKDNTNCWYYRLED